jgi:hypothetical protein
LELTTRTTVTWVGLSIHMSCPSPKMTTAVTDHQPKHPYRRVAEIELTYLGPNRHCKSHEGRSHNEIVVPPQGSAESLRAGEHAAAEGDHGDGEEAPIYGPVLVAIIADWFCTCRPDDLFRLCSRPVSLWGVRVRARKGIKTHSALLLSCSW